MTDLELCEVIYTNYKNKTETEREFVRRYTSINLLLSDTNDYVTTKKALIICLLFCLDLDFEEVSKMTHKERLTYIYLLGNNT